MTKRAREDQSQSQLQGGSLQLLLELREQAENVLLANTKTEFLGDALSNVTFTYRFPVPCRNAPSVQESTSSLLAARAFSKAGRSQDAWDTLESLFSVQATNGMLPKYRYSPSNDSTSYFINDMDIPNWPLFQNMSQSFFPPKTCLATKFGVRTSARILGVPLHASLVLEVFYLSNQTSHDLQQLQRNFDRLYKSHNYLHTVVMRGCHSNSHLYNTNTNTTIPCYNVVHPWETLLETDSPLMDMALQQVKKLMKKKDWKPPPNSTRDDDNSVASLFLLECIQNATVDCIHNCEDSILQNCPFAMLDVGHAAFLQKADLDLLTMAHILQDTHGSNLHLPQLIEWKEQSSHVMEHCLWNDEHQTFLSKIILLEETNNSTIHNNPTLLVSQTSSKWLEHAVSNNFLALWSDDESTDTSRLDSMTFHMLERQGKFAFDCGSYPLWSLGACLDATVSPLMNYLVSRGLHSHRVLGLDTFLANSTLNLICGIPNQVVHDNNHSHACGRKNVSFFKQYNGSSGRPISHPNTCGETVTAAVVYNLLVPEKPFHYIPAPPMNGDWVITLVVAELVIAFSVGLCCLVLNLNILRRLNADSDGHALLTRMENEGEGRYFSAAASLEEETNEGPT